MTFITCDFCGKKIQPLGDRTRLNLSVVDTKNIIYVDMCVNCKGLAEKIQVKHIQEMLLKLRDKE